MVHWYCGWIQIRVVVLSQWVCDRQRKRQADLSCSVIGEERFSRSPLQSLLWNTLSYANSNNTSNCQKIILAGSKPCLGKSEKNLATFGAFQGIRITLSNELGDLENGLEAATKALKVGRSSIGGLSVFILLKDRMFKRFMKLQAERALSLPRHLPNSQCTSWI